MIRPRGPVTRKIELAQQIEEMQRLVGDARMAAQKRGAGQGLAEEKLARQEGILATLEFCRDNEGDIREFITLKRARAS